MAADAGEDIGEIGLGVEARELGGFDDGHRVDEDATVATIRAAVVELDQAYAAEDVATIDRLTTPDSGVTASVGGSIAAQHLRLRQPGQGVQR